MSPLNLQLSLSAFLGGLTFTQWARLINLGAFFLIFLVALCLAPKYLSRKEIFIIIGITLVMCLPLLMLFF